MMQDRRRFIRWQIKKAAQIKLTGAATSVFCTVHDISMKGACISLAQNLPADSALEAQITLCDECVLQVQVWVVWHRRIMEKNVYGVYFTMIRDSHKESIYQFMRKYFHHYIEKQWWQDSKPEGGETEMQQLKINNAQDRRIFERFSTKFPVRFIDLRRNREGEAEALNVSAKGLGITAKDELSPLTPIEMWLDIPDRGEPIYTRGEVVWSKLAQPGQWQVGVNLEKADLMGMSRILRMP